MSIGARAAADPVAAVHATPTTPITRQVMPAMAKAAVLARTPEPNKVPLSIAILLSLIHI